MGSSASCSIVLAPTDKPFYWTGETISGHIVLTVDTSLNVKSINLKMIGQLIYTETRQSSGSGNHTTTVTVRRNFFAQNHPRFIPATNGISYDEDGYYIQPNTYRWPFSMHVPEGLPPSLVASKIDVPYIEYFFEIVLGRSWLHHDIRSKQIIKVTPRVPIPRNVWSPQSEDSNFRGLHVSGILRRNYLLIGEPYITLGLNIQNPSHTTIKEIIVTLIQRRLLDGHVGRTIIFTQPLPDIIDFQDDHLHHTFQVPVVPFTEFFAPTSYYKKPGDRGQLWTVEYLLEVAFKTRLSFFTNIKLEFPLTVVNSKR